ncbi:hypothetical protein WJ96_06825 [Burkholderia ubonensis]|uniref:Uncharacterized protein n=1 Tax=Burkholderia ubonensis TaxID=101571 RepID=A0AAW3MWS4_9BURK|nr:hypothetical protein [Burkholderia ubonensis]KVP75417.1 hypothetical protein WJ93_08620 [Burkholderia ubonensis]KVP98230.1 hypothetical protein WJ96_06825 [Burkholderia ubonensis]KVZ92927.1 hypothetical protein WL25_18485 [Burkholderia ubonensis]
MAQTFDTQPYYRKLANNEALTEDEVVALLKAVDMYQASTAYLADCHAATLESLPKSTSKSERARQKSICLTAAGLLDGDTSGIRHQSRPDAAQARCRRAVESVN